MTTLFESTIPVDAPELMCASRFVQYLRTEGHTMLPHADLPRSLQRDPSRFAAAESGGEMLAVMAAWVRHGERLMIQLRCGGSVVSLTVFPRERLAYSPLPIETLIATPPAEMRIIHLEPATIQPPGSDSAPIGPTRLYRPLAPLLWAMAMRGPRATLLPEIAGAASPMGPDSTASAPADCPTPFTCSRPSSWPAHAPRPAVTAAVTAGWGPRAHDEYQLTPASITPPPRHTSPS